MMRSFLVLACMSAVLLILSSCAEEAAAPPPLPFRLVTGTHELMEGLVAPAAEIVFKSVGYRADEQGIQEIVPKNDEEWEIVEHSALGLAESANLLLLEGRAPDPEWVQMSHDMIDTSVVAAKAAEAHDVDALLNAGEKIFEVCTACHLKYIP